jgi:hypothetical protein
LVGLFSHLVLLLVVGDFDRDLAAMRCRSARGFGAARRRSRVHGPLRNDASSWQRV